LANLRLKEAKALYDRKLYDGACYLAGYVVELALKARICKLLDVDYPDTGDLSKIFKTHNCDSLLVLSGLRKKFDDEESSNTVFKTNWSLATKIKPEFRYQRIGPNPKTETEEIIKALEDPNDGVFTWIKKRW
jgi:HEPN domain-containing protein